MSDLARRRAAERRKLSRGLRSARFASVVGDWRKALLVPRATRRTVTGPSTAELSADRTRRAYTRVIRLGVAITDSSPAESLHTLRKRSKELRYVLEFFASLHDPAVYRATLGDLKRLQDCLGEFQDSEVQREDIQSFAVAMLAERPPRRPPCWPWGSCRAARRAPAPGPRRIRGTVCRVRREDGPGRIETLTAGGPA